MSGTPDVSYGAWTQPGSPYQVRYALPVFREIEVYVNEGFRRIPYGGIEHGGLLFGKHSGDLIYIEAFRAIECEHAAGPSFSLSERDLAGIRQQLANYTGQPELAGLTPVGMFISHSRRDLPMTSDEESLLAQLFPEPWQCLLVVKPEKFKAAQFGFVFRKTSGVDDAKPAEGAFALPLHSRSAPVEMAEAAPVEQVPESKPKPSRARVRRAAAKPKPALEIRESREPVPLPAPTPRAQSSTTDRPRRFTRARFAAGAILLSALALAACFLWFYWNYLQAPLEIHAAALPRSIVVTWPAQATAGASDARLRISANQHEKVIKLSPAERQSGRATIPISSSDVTIELVAPYWLHERRGMVRVITNR